VGGFSLLEELYYKRMKPNLDLKSTFNTAANLYDKVRPGYPAELFHSLVREAHIITGSKLLEIGPGTGQATAPLAKLGCQLTAIELGADMADIARHNLAAFPNVNVITGSFEDTKLPPSFFDLVYAATAFHWLRPEAKFTKPHALLQPGGHLAIIRTIHVGDDVYDKFYQASHPIYERFDQVDNRTPDRHPLTPKGLPRIEDVVPEGLDAQLFEQAYFRCFPMIATYAAAEYIELLGTYSPHLAMPEAKRSEFFAEIRALIDQDFGGQLTKPYAMSLTIGKKIN
jgi:SAM-dependent methyltransferase